MNKTKGIVFVSPSERCGTTWAMKMLISHPKVTLKTEPFKQQLPIYHPLHPFSGRPTLPLTENHERWMKKVMEWHQSSSHIAIIKETNLSFRASWFFAHVARDSGIILHFRNLISVCNSFYRNDLVTRWGYRKIFDNLVDEASKTESLDRERRFIKAFDHRDPNLIVAFFYVLNTLQMIQYTSPENRLVSRYEDVFEDPEKYITSLLEFFGLSTSEIVTQTITDTKTSRANDQLFSTLRRENANRLVLAQDDLERIRDFCGLAEEMFSELSSSAGQELWKPFYNTNYAPAFIPRAPASSRLSPSTREIKPVGRDELTEICLERSRISKELYKFPSVKIPASGRNISCNLVTNRHFCAFLNHQIKEGWSPLESGQYDYLNFGMNPNRGGRIFLQDSGTFGILRGYEDHPVNWITYSGAVTFSEWVGCDLPEAHEYDDVECHYFEGDSISNENTSNLVGDTRPISLGRQESVIDLKGNVMTWTKTSVPITAWYSGRVVKGGAFNAPPRPRGFSLNKLEIFTSHDLGLRVCWDPSRGL
jgi:hypothetical protein